MNWSDLSVDWTTFLTAVARRFPYLDASLFRRSNTDLSTLVQAVAQSHDLTEHEAREELEDFLLIQSLSRDMAELPTLGTAA
ncbi:hypothetical protein [Planktotalea sp.]|uniref:hypothetical protein n=1 Tax=Planktotalea sp. TaxID=2029877 RepID=UPI003D6A0DD2